MKKLITPILAILLFTLTSCVPVEEPKEKSVDEEPTEELVEETSEEIADYEYYMACDNNKFPFELYEEVEGHGQVVFTGTIIKELEERPWSMDENDLIPVIRMKVNDADITEALEYYKNMVNGGNTVNSFKDEKLSFRIGTFENEEFSSTAKISETTLDNIFNALESGEEISLTITQAFLPGMGAPENFSFACEISD